MKGDIKEVLFTERQISERVSELGKRISADFSGKNPLLVGILKGSAIFTADLARAIDIPCELDFMAVSSYGAGTSSSGEVKIKKDIDIDIRGRDVIIVEDILDSGNTLSRLTGIIKDRGANSVSVCVLLDKPSRRQVDVSVDYTGFAVCDEFVVGYGLDFNQKYRNLPFVGVLKPEIYE